MERNPRVFFCHRSTDKPRVADAAAKLAAKGIDPWLDIWEIRPGDNFLEKINDGLDQCDAGLIFLSKNTFNGKFIQSEIDALVQMRIDHNKPLIFVDIDLDIDLPPLQRTISRLGIDQIDLLADALFGRTGKPVVAPPPGDTQTRRFVIRLAGAETGITASAELDGNAVASQTTPLGPGFYFSYADFVSHSGGDPNRALTDMGRAIGRVVFAGDIGARLEALLAEAGSANQQVELVVETADSKLLAIPFEAASLENGRVVSLEPSVTMFRRLAGMQSAAPDPRAGPLKILVAVAAPDEDKSKNTVLDIERELQTILDATREAEQHGNVFTRILEVGALDHIRGALSEQSYHVLHLSGHGTAGTMELEDEDGAAVPATAQEIAAAIRDSRHPAPLIVLAACHSGRGDTQTAGLAEGLLRNGMPSVVAMQSAVTDVYSTKLAGAFYRHLANDERPLASAALAKARRDLENERRKDREKPQSGALPAEFATPTFFCGPAEKPILNRDLDKQPPRVPPRLSTAGTVPLLRADDLIGRRKELRRLMRVLTDDQRSVRAEGRKAGCQICAIGGAGKSALAGRIMERLAAQHWMVATPLSSVLSLGGIVACIAAAIAGRDDLAPAARALGAESTPDQVRLQLIGGLLGQQPLLLVLDNFEDNLKLGGSAFLDPLMAQLMEMLCRSAQRGKLLITSRYAVPGLEDWLATEHLGPLSFAEIRKLFLRLTALNDLNPEDQRLIQRAIGGHPRALEYVNAILSRGNARMPDVARRLRAEAKKLGIDLTVTAVTVEEALARTLQVAAHDILLDELLAIVGADKGTLLQAAVFPTAVPVAALAECLGVSGVELGSALDRLAQSSLLTRLPGERVFVHRWTAEALAKRTEPQSWREGCRKAGEYLLGTHEIADVVEAVRLFLAAEEYDRAAKAGEGVLAFLIRYGRAADLAAMSREIATGLPQSHGRHWAFLGTEADALQMLGLSGEAVERWRHVAESLEKRSRAQPERFDFLRDLSVSYTKMGDLMVGLGSGEEARQFFGKSLEIADRLVKQEPGQAAYLRDLSVAYTRMGDLMVGLGSWEEARQFFEKDLGIAERLLKQEPDRADYLRDLSVSYNKMGGLMVRLGSGEAARQFFGKSMEIRERLVNQEPDRADYLHSLSASYQRMGDLMVRLGSVKEALQFFGKLLAIWKRLVNQEPGRADYLHNLLTSYGRMGDLMVGLGSWEEARQFLAKSLEIADRLVKQEPGQADYLRALSVSYNKMGGLMVRLGSVEKARQFFGNSLEIAERLVKREPDRADYQADLVTTLVHIGTRAALTRALGIASRMEQQSKLTAEQSGWVAALTQLLAAATD